MRASMSEDFRRGGGKRELLLYPACLLLMEMGIDRTRGGRKKKKERGIDQRPAALQRTQEGEEGEEKAHAAINRSWEEYVKKGEKGKKGKRARPPSFAQFSGGKRRKKQPGKRRGKRVTFPPGVGKERGPRTMLSSTKGGKKKTTQFFHRPRRLRFSQRKEKEGESFLTASHQKKEEEGRLFTSSKGSVRPLRGQRKREKKKRRGLYNVAERITRGDRRGPPQKKKKKKKPKLFTIFRLKSGEGRKRKGKEVICGIHRGWEGKTRSTATLGKHKGEEASASTNHHTLKSRLHRKRKGDPSLAHPQEGRKEIAPLPCSGGTKIGQWKIPSP